MREFARDRRGLLREQAIETPAAFSEVGERVGLRQSGRLDRVGVGLGGEALVAAASERLGEGWEAGLRSLDDVVAGLAVDVKVTFDDVELCPLGRASDGDVALSNRDTSVGW